MRKENGGREIQKQATFLGQILGIRLKAELEPSWEGTFRGVNPLNGDRTEWRIVEHEGDYHWIENPDSGIGAGNRLTRRNGGLEAEDSGERFRFTLVEDGLRFEMWRKKTEEKLADVVLERIEPEEDDGIIVRRQLPGASNLVRQRGAQEMTPLRQ